MKNHCKFGIATCDGINGNSLFVCNGCVEDAEFEAELNEETARRCGDGRPASEVIEEDVTRRRPIQPEAEDGSSEIGGAE